jgi:hypothetical protein
MMPGDGMHIVYGLALEDVSVVDRTLTPDS